MLALALWVLIVLALLNGTCIVCNRVINAKLGSYVGHLRSSYWNHLVGAVFLVPLLLLFTNWRLYLGELDALEWPLYTGGLVGVVFVWMVNWVMPRLGALKVTLILLTSQMLSGLVLDVVLDKIESLSMAVLGMGLILIGVFLGKLAK